MRLTGYRKAYKRGANGQQKREAIARTRQFFTETMHMPATLHEVGITDEEHFDVMAQKAADGSKGSFVPLTKEDIVEIYRAAK